MREQDEITLWVREFSDALYRWALFKTSDEETSRDLVQDTFLAAVKSKEHFDGKSSPKTWLFRIMNNKIVDYYRSKNRIGKATVPLDEEMATQVTKSFFDDAGSWDEATTVTHWYAETHLLDNTEFNKVMELCMDELPLNWHTAVTAKYFSDKSSNEICKDLDITSSNYWQIVHRAKLLLKKCIETNWKTS